MHRDWLCVCKLCNEPELRAERQRNIRLIYKMSNAEWKEPPLANGGRESFCFFLCSSSLYSFIVVVSLVELASSVSYQFGQSIFGVTLARIYYVVVGGRWHRGSEWRTNISHHISQLLCNGRTREWWNIVSVSGSQVLCVRWGLPRSLFGLAQFFPRSSPFIGGELSWAVRRSCAISHQPAATMVEKLVFWTIHNDIVASDTRTRSHPNRHNVYFWSFITVDGIICRDSWELMGAQRIFHAKNKENGVSFWQCVAANVRPTPSTPAPDDEISFLLGSLLSAMAQAVLCRRLSSK